MMDVEKLREVMDGNRIVFLSLDSVGDSASAILKEMANGDEKIIFISVSKPAMTRKKHLNDEGISDENIFFIDGSKVEDKEIRAKNIVYVNPSNLTDLSISLSQAVENLSPGGPVVVMLDALEALGLYSDEKQFRRFIHALCNKMRRYEVPVVLMGSSNTLDEEMRSLITQFADETFT